MIIKEKMEQCFKYLISIFQNDGSVDGNVMHRFQTGWTKGAMKVLYDHKVSQNSKLNFIGRLLDK